MTRDRPTLLEPEEGSGRRGSAQAGTDSGPGSYGSPSSRRDPPNPDSEKIPISDLDQTRSRVDGLVYLDTQQAAVGLDVTAGEIFRLASPASLDFGGSQLQAAGREKVVPELRDEADDYGWWELEPGSYLVRYNEALDLDDGELAHVSPLERLLLAGAFHPAIVVDGPRDPLETLLQVGEARCDLEENCRVLRVLVTERG